MSDDVSSEPPFGPLGVGAPDPVDADHLPLPVFAAAVAFEVVSFIPWPAVGVPVAYPVAAMAGLGPGYTILDHQGTSLLATTNGKYPGPLNARDVRVGALEALADRRRRGKSVEDALEVAVGDWEFSIVLAPELHDAAERVLSSLGRAQDA